MKYADLDSLFLWFCRSLILFHSIYFKKFHLFLYLEFYHIRPLLYWYSIFNRRDETLQIFHTACAFAMMRWHRTLVLHRPSKNVYSIIMDSISLQISYQMRFQYRPGIALLTDGGINNMFMIELSKLWYLWSNSEPFHNASQND